MILSSLYAFMFLLYIINSGLTSFSGFFHIVPEKEHCYNKDVGNDNHFTDIPEEGYT